MKTSVHRVKKYYLCFALSIAPCMSGLKDHVAGDVETKYLAALATFAAQDKVNINVESFTVDVNGVRQSQGVWAFQKQNDNSFSLRENDLCVLVGDSIFFQRNLRFNMVIIDYDCGDSLHFDLAGNVWSILKFPTLERGHWSNRQNGACFFIPTSSTYDSIGYFINSNSPYQFDSIAFYRNVLDAPYINTYVLHFQDDSVRMNQPITDIVSCLIKKDTSCVYQLYPDCNLLYR